MAFAGNQNEPQHPYLHSSFLKPAQGGNYQAAAGTNYKDDENNRNKQEEEQATKKKKKKLRKHSFDSIDPLGKSYCLSWNYCYRFRRVCKRHRQDPDRRVPAWSQANSIEPIQWN